MKPTAVTSLILATLSVAVPNLLAAPKAVESTDAAPGLVGAYYQKINTIAALDKTKDKPFLVRVDKSVDFASVDGQFYGSKLAVNFGVRWTGLLKVDAPGTYTLTVKADDLCRVYVNDDLVADAKEGQVNKDVSGKVTFPAAGTYPVRVEFVQQQGGAGVTLSWTKPGSDKPEAIPAAAFSHEKSTETAIAWDKDVWSRKIFSTNNWKKGDKFAEMDYGPFLSHTIEAGENNTVCKGIVLKLGPGRNTGNVLFDTDLCRYACGWTGGWLGLHGVAFDGAHGPSPSVEGNVTFSSVLEPGGKEGPVETVALKDPRPNPWGPLPHDQAHYKGLYRNGNHTVLNYSVGDTDVLELPKLEMIDGKELFTRTIRLSASDQPLMLLAADDKQPVKVFAAWPMHVRDFDGHQYVIFPARSKATTYKIGIHRADSGLSPQQIAFYTGAKEDVVAFTKGGPKLWGEPVTTHGTLGKTDGPYAVDTLTVPEENPYHSWMRIGGLDFFPDGHSAAVCTWSGDVWIVSGIDDSLQNLKWQRYATGLFQTLGLKIVDGDVFVLGRDQITHLHDLNKDGEADWYENFNNDCQVSSSFHEFTFDLQRDSKGNFYYVKAGPVRPGGRGWQTITDHNGTMMRVSADGKHHEVFATGLRAPNGMMVGPRNDVITVADNEGTWTPACRIDYDVKKGDFLGVTDLARIEPKPTKPGKLLCWLPHGDVDNSSGGQVWVTSSNWGPFEDELLALSYGKCSLFKVLKENVDGTWQGGVVKFPLGFNTGIMRGRFNPADGQLYLVGLRGWQTDAARDAGFQRVRYTGKPVNMPTDLHVKKDGVEVAFTRPVDDSTAKDPQNYDLEQWNYIWSSDYGSPEMSVENPKQKGHDPVDVESVTVAPDHKSVFLKIDNLQPVMQMKIHMKIKAADGSPLDYAIYNTIQKIPGAKNTNVAGATEK